MFWSRSSCLKFSIISSLSLIRFLSPFRLEIDRECDLTLIVLVLTVLVSFPPPLADSDDLLDLALPDRYLPPLSDAEKALPRRSLGAKFA